MPIETHIEQDPQWFNDLFSKATAGAGATTTPTFDEKVTHKPVEEKPTEVESTVTPEKKEVVNLSENQLDDLLFSPEKEEKAESKNDSNASVDEKVSDTDEDVELTPDEFKAELIKSTVKKLIDDGKWMDIEGLDELEYDEDTFVKISELQAQHAASHYVEQVAQQNEIIAGIFEAHRNGVDLDTVLDLFKEQKSIADIDVSTSQGKLEKIKRYLEDVEELPKETVKKKLKLLDIDEEALETEFEIVENKYQSYFQQEQQRLIQERQQEEARKTKERNTQIYTRFNALKEAGFKEAEAKQLLANVYTDNLKLQDGTAISQFDYKLMQIQSDPKKHLELIQFVLDPEKYKKQLTQQAANVATEKVARKISVIPQRTATSVSKPTPKSNSIEFAQGLLKTLS